MVRTWEMTSEESVDDKRDSGTSGTNKASLCIVCCCQLFGRKGERLENHKAAVLKLTGREV
jgi:hypothetical protein